MKQAKRKIQAAADQLDAGPTEVLPFAATPRSLPFEVGAVPPRSPLSDSMAIDSTEAARPIPQSAARWEDFVDIYVAPAEVFRRRRDGRFGLALVVLTILTTALTFVMVTALSGALEADMIRGMQAAGGEVNEDAIQTMRSVGRVVTVGGTLVSVPVAVFLAAVVMLGVGRLFSVRSPMRVWLTVATFAAFPRLLGILAAILQGVIGDPASMNAVSVGPARFLPLDSSPLLLGLLGRLDVFTLWGVALVAIGGREAADASKGDSWLISVIVWALGSLVIVIPALLR